MASSALGQALHILIEYIISMFLVFFLQFDVSCILQPDIQLRTASFVHGLCDRDSPWQVLVFAIMSLDEPGSIEAVISSVSATMFSLLPSENLPLYSILQDM